MKNIIGFLGACLLLVTGCQSSDLEDYQQALLETQGYASGIQTSHLSVELTFNEDNLSFEEIRDLSYYETIEIATVTQYNLDEGEPQAVSDAYFNFGGMGFDMIYYMEGEAVLIKLPIIDQYIRVNMEENQVNQGDAAMEQSKAIRKIIDAWNDVLEDEDVFSGKKAYVLTDKGQIKTTTYQVMIDETQFELLKKTVLDVMDDEAVVKAFLEQSDGLMTYQMSEAEIQGIIKDMVEAITLESFEGEAYVDFDGRLVKQVFTVALINQSAGPGEVESIDLVYESGYDQLGEPQVIDFPTIGPEELLQIKEGTTIEDYFPEGIF